MAETSRHQKEIKEAEETRRTLVLRMMFQKKEKGEKRKYLPEEKRKYLQNSALSDLVPGQGLDHIVHKRTFQIFVLGQVQDDEISNLFHETN